MMVYLLNFSLYFNSVGIKSRTGVPRFLFCEWPRDGSAFPWFGRFDDCFRKPSLRKEKQIYSASESTPGYGQDDSLWD
eukprot:scaffold20446_cov118-Amphora_coffeaeformis.AAC.2